MELLDGKALSNKLKNALKEEIETLKKEHNIVPGLAVVLVGSDAASQAYVSMKSKACKAIGIYSIVHEMPDAITHAEILEIIKMMNQNNYIDGILVQLPLPSQVDTILEKTDGYVIGHIEAGEKGCDIV